MSYVTHADLGGRPMDEPVTPEPEGTPFHGRWEERVHAITLAMGGTGLWNIDMSRAARETLPDYAALSYYEKWFAGLEKLLRERDLVSAAEIAAGRALGPGRVLPRVLAAADVAAVLARGAPTERPATMAARFTTGQRVRTRAEAVPHHTRLPGYARGKCGVVERIRGVHVYADAHAQGQGERPQWLYTVVFTADELWGTARPPGRQSVAIDAWEPYLEAE